MTGDILIAGGYGAVGGRVARELAPDHPGRIVIAGRDLDRAEKLAASIGSGARARRVDVRDRASVDRALAGVSLVVSCIDQPERQLFEAALDGGLAYTDITPHLMALRGTDLLDRWHERARRSGARVIIGTGLAPGISNMLVRAAADRAGGSERIETSILLSVGDDFGPASTSYLLEEIASPFAVHVDGAYCEARPLTSPAPIAFPPPLGKRRAYLFPFSDQVFYPRTMGARTAITRLALEPSSVGTLAAALVRVGATKLLTRPGVRQRFAGIVRRLHGLHAGSDDVAIVVEVTGTKRVRATFHGHVQAAATAMGAALIARALEAEVRDAGVWLPEQVVNPAPFIRTLSDRGWQIAFSDAAR